MRFVYGRQDMTDHVRAQEGCFLMTNGLGGYASLSHAFSMTRADQGLLVAARTAPNDRVTLLARMAETLCCAAGATVLSTQDFAGDTPAETGWRFLSSLTVEDVPLWIYDVRGVQISREVGMQYGENTVALRYRIANRTAEPCKLTLHPQVLGFEKGYAPEKEWDVQMSEDGRIVMGDQQLYLRTNGSMAATGPVFCMQTYRHDAPDGRPDKGLAAGVGEISLTVPAGERAQLWVVASDRPGSADAEEIISGQKRRMQELRAQCGLHDDAALQLASAADAFVVERFSTAGKSIIAGYPFFGDWGRDTMIALPGCCLSTRRYEEAKSILRTFLAYEKDGLVPNLFPEGENAPMYNTVDAALLLINTVWLYVEATGDLAFAHEAWPVMERIVAAYRRGTRHGIHMDADGLICAGEGFDQVTWMDVRIGEILPTPRHGKPVEINAYWYSALRVMETLAARLGTDAADYAALAQQVKAAFIPAFWMVDRACLKDVVSGTAADTQIRCNQIWAVTQPFTMLTPEQEHGVVDAVYAHLYTPCGLRTLSPEDPQYHGVYAGVQKERDMAYHQGTVWPFPLGAYYLAYLKVHGSTQEAAAEVRSALAGMPATLREGCTGQLPEIYDGDVPAFSRGCFAQAWSVGELLRVYAELEKIETA